MGQLLSRPRTLITKWLSKADTCMVDDEMRQALVVETGFSARQVDRLHIRFTQLDKGCKGYLTMTDIESIPGMSDNPLGQRIARAMAREDDGGANNKDQDIQITFRSFCKSFSHFKAESSEEDDDQGDLWKLLHQLVEAGVLPTKKRLTRHSHLLVRVWQDQRQSLLFCVIFFSGPTP